MDETNALKVPTFHSKIEKNTQENPSKANALMRETPGLPGKAGIRRKRREYLQKAQKKEDNFFSEEEEEEDDDDDDDDDDEDEKTEVKRKIVALQRIVPGGESFGVDKLFEETAGYILALQCQIKAMRALTSFIEGLEKHKTKLGG